MNNNIPKYFILTSLFFMALGCLEGLMFPTKFQFQPFYSAIFHLPAEYLKPFFGSFLVKIHTHINLIGWVGSALMGILYFIAPQINPKGHYKRILAYLNLISHVAGLLIFTTGFHVIGVVGLKSGANYGSEAFRAVVAPYKMLTMTGGILITISAVIFAYNMVRVLLATKK
ncbi:MAG: hypothetical protein JW927_20050 [Deltaproteobacteria bacterium]|nr:hypothetical protein [Deltaproteobacteria bacterium]